MYGEYLSTNTHTLLTQYALCTVTHIRHTLRIFYNISFKICHISKYHCMFNSSYEYYVLIVFEEIKYELIS